MGIEYSSVIDSSRDEVFAWHDRPGAIRRLLPPWQPAGKREQQELESAAPAASRPATVLASALATAQMSGRDWQSAWRPDAASAARRKLLS